MSLTSYDIHNQLLQFDAHCAHYKDTPHKGIRYRLRFSKKSKESKHMIKAKTKTPLKQNKHQTITFTLLPVQSSITVTTAGKALIKALQETQFPPRKETCSNSPTLPATLIITNKLPMNTQDELYQTLISYMNVFAPGVFDSSKDSTYTTCSITKGVQRNWVMEKETGHMAFTTVGTYSGGELLIRNDMEITPGTQEAIDALQKSGNLPKISTNSKNVSALGSALTMFPSITAYVVEHMLPMSTRPIFCRLLREQSGVLAIKDSDKPSVAVKKLLDIQKAKKEKQQSLKTTKNTKTTKATQKKKKKKDTEVLLLQVLALLFYAGYRFVDKDLKLKLVIKKHNLIAKRLQLLLGDSIKSFEAQFENNCAIHSLNNATYWYRRQKGITKQIGSIEFDLINERFYAYTEGRDISNTKDRMLSKNYSNNFSHVFHDFINNGFVDGKLRIQDHIHPTSRSRLFIHKGYYTYTSRLYLFKMGLNIGCANNEKSFINIMNNYAWTKSFLAIIICVKVVSKTISGNHCVSLRREPPNKNGLKNMWLYQDSNEPLKQISIHGDTPQKLWDFIQQTRYYSRSGARLDFIDCDIIWSN